MAAARGATSTCRRRVTQVLAGTLHSRTGILLCGFFVGCHGWQLSSAGCHGVQVPKGWPS